MNSELYTLSKLFTERIFRIPDFQRGYAWDKKQLADFWSDLEYLEDGKNHYTGVLTLETVPSEVHSNWTQDRWIIESRRFDPFYVVDGQQRLTTAVILIQSILERIKEDDTLNYTSKTDIQRKYIFESRDKGISRSYLFGYERDNPSYEYLKTKIFDEPSSSDIVSTETVYTSNLAYAKRYLSERIASLDHKQLESLYTRLTQHFLFNIYTIEKDIDVFVAFETMNNRGKPLSHLELLKNRLIYLSTRLGQDESDRAVLRQLINDCWKAVYHQLGRNKDMRIGDDALLQTHFLFFFAKKLIEQEKLPEVPLLFVLQQLTRSHMVQEEGYKRYLLDEFFVARQATLDAEAIKEYGLSIKKSAEVFFALLNPSAAGVSAEESVWLTRLSRISRNEPGPLLLGLYLIENDASKRIRVLERYERLLFVYSLRIYLDRHERLSVSELGVRYAAGRITTDGVVDTLESELKKHVPTIGPAVFGLTRDMGYYGWLAVRYFLFEYEQDLLAKSKTSRSKLDWETFFSEKYEKDYLTVEHIYPQKVRSDCWRVGFNDYVLKQRNLLRNSLGNLLPLSRPKNSSLGNKCFSEKKGNGRDAGYSNGCYSEIEVARELTWGPEQIRDRGVRLLEFMERRWQLDLGDRADKIRMLGLAFLEGADDADSGSDEASEE